MMRRLHLSPAPAAAAPAPAGRPWGPWVSRLALAVLLAAALAALQATGGFRLVDRAVHDLRMRGHDIAASGGLVVVEIDASSLHRLGQWPWPRGHHAKVLERLIAAGAARVGFDVSFSSPSDPAQDDRLRVAAEAAGDRMLLPVFQQWHTRPDGSLWLLIDRPLPQLFGDVPVAAINVVPDDDGIVRRLPVRVGIDGVMLPFMATALAGGAGQDVSDPYLVDFGIDPATLPRLSFADVLLGDFDPALVAGRTVLIGATAIELGDVLAVPRWGNLAGPLVLATGYESLVQERAIRPLDQPWLVFALCLAAALAAPRIAGLAPTLLAAGAQLVTMGGVSQLLYVEWALRLDLGAPAAALLIAHGLTIGRLLRAQARRIQIQNREAARRQALLRSVVATSIDAVVITDRNGLISLANPACRNVFGQDPDRLVGIAAVELISPGDRIVPLLRAMEGGGGLPDLPYPVDVEGLHADGHPLALELALAEVAAADAQGLDDSYSIYVFRDVSVQRQLEASRRMALEARLEAERAKTDFLATASHELRTPLNHIQGFAALLAAGIGGTLSAKQAGYVADIDTAARHLFELVTDILAYAEQSNPDEDTRTEDRTVVTVGDLVTGACAALEALAERRQVRIKVAGNGLGALLSVDRPAMERSLMHVLRNAVQFSPSGGVVAVMARMHSSGTTVALAIADHGSGMEPAQIAHVLTAFGQAEGAFARSHGGLGVGLALARSCAERHGGRLSLASAPRQGTTVTFDLPLAEDEVAAA